MLRETGRYLTFDVLDGGVFMLAALGAPSARHFAGASNRIPPRLAAALMEAREEPVINRIEARDYITTAFRIDHRTRPVLAALLTRTRAMWDTYHWWIYSDDTLLISAYDWDGGPSLLHPSLQTWAREMEVKEAIKLTGAVVSSDEWFDERDRLWELEQYE